MPGIGVSCKACTYWDPFDPANADRGGECRRRAPIASDGGTYPIAVAKWPVTTAKDWCGEFDDTSCEE